MRRHNVVIPREDGGVEVYRMKAWLRQHPERAPAGIDLASATAHQVSRGFRRDGWSIQVTETEVRHLAPDSSRLEAIVEDVLGEESDDDSEENFLAFELEYQLRDFLAKNLSGILVEGKRLRLYHDQDGRPGVEYPTAVGPIDILAYDDDAQQFVVFELKRARSPDHAIGQLTRYMGWIRRTIGSGKTVRGVIVAKSISENLRYSVAVVPNVSLLIYKLKFELETAQSLAG